MFLKSVLSGAASAYYLLQLRRNQWKSSQELKEIQFKRLNSFVHYAYDYIPYYRRLFKSASFKPDDLRSLGDLRKIPTTTKMDLRRNYSNMIAKGVDTSKYHVSYTSGSTGIPLKVLSDQNTYDYSNALVAYSSLECGLGLRDKLVDMRSRVQYFFRHMPNIIFIPGPLESVELNVIVNRLQRIKPDAIYTIPWILRSLCNLDVSGIKPKLIFTHASTLTDHVRELVRSNFGIEANDTYGAVEFNRLAFECNEHSGLHIMTDNSFIEFLDDGESVSPGETGEIVVTGLINYAMPLIRYEIGDLGVPSDEICSCGRSWPLIKRIEGRKFDFVTLESGRKIYPNFFHTRLLDGFKDNLFCVSEYQVVQEKKNRIVLKFTKGSNFDRNLLNNIKESIENDFKKLYEDVIVEVQVIEEIPVEKTGKKNLIISMIE
jgi:phenylacetate-CoA ligase